MSVLMYRFLFLIGLVFQLVSCQDSDDNNSTTINFDNTILATVNDTKISQADLNFAMLETLGSNNVSLLGAEGENKFLQSMVASKSMAILSFSSLTKSERHNLQNKIAAYKEQLLVKRYLKNTIVPEPVTTKMVEDYYLQHPEKFGAENIFDFSVIQIKNLTENMRALAVRLLNEKVDGISDLNAISMKLKQSDINAELVFKRASKTQLKTGKEFQILFNLKEGEVSKVYFIDFQPRLIKVEKITTLPPKPLHEVSLEIRKSLVPVQLKRSVKEASEKALEQTKIIYH